MADEKKRSKTPRTDEQQAFLDAAHKFKFLPNKANGAMVLSTMEALRIKFCEDLGINVNQAQ